MCSGGFILIRQRFSALFVIITLFLGSVPAFAQNDQQDQSAAQYILPGGSNTIRMAINVWGEVQRPGIYRVPSDITLVELISSAGGPTDLAKIKKVRVIHAYPQNGEAQVIKVNLKDYLKDADISGLPKLYPGDTVFIPASFRSYFTTTVGIAASITTLFSAVALIWERLSRAGSI